MTRLVLVLGDQLTPTLSALRAADAARDVVVMAEVDEETTYVRHHPKKIAFVLAAMRHFAEELRSAGWTVDYSRLDDGAPHASIEAALLSAAATHGATEVIATEPGEWRLIQQLSNMVLPVTQLPDDRFLASHDDFDRWADGRKELRLEWFYRDMRRRTGLLMEDDAPAGGAWNYDAENRKSAPATLQGDGPQRFAPDAVTDAVLDLVEDRFDQHFGTLRPFWFAVTRGQAEAAFQNFLKASLPFFGDFQDAMMDEEPFLYHAVIGLYLNVGLLDPLAVCRAAEAEWENGNAPLNAVEGFIRQIIGWREFVRGVYFREGPDYTGRNALAQTRNLPDFFWSGETQMRCVAQVVGQTREEAYAHHIQRLMVTGNFALLAGLNPTDVHDWYLSVYADAFEWVEAPNVIGMSQFADGGVFASKPYVSSGTYIDKMSNYCGRCAYSVKTKVGAGACPFNLLYWDFLIRHKERFKANPRISRAYATWDRMAEEKRDQILSEAAAWLRKMDAGACV